MKKVWEFIKITVLAALFYYIFNVCNFIPGLIFGLGGLGGGFGSVFELGFFVIFNFIIFYLLYKVLAVNVFFRNYLLEEKIIYVRYFFIISLILYGVMLSAYISSKQVIILLVLLFIVYLFANKSAHKGLSGQQKNTTIQ